MKIRIHNNFIRLRLDQEEVASLETGNIVSCTTAIPGSPLTYSVRPDQQSDISSSMSHGEIQVTIPDNWINGWLDSDREGFENENQSEIRIAIEKDYKCLHREPEDGVKNFENPAAG